MGTAVLLGCLATFGVLGIALIIYFNIKYIVKALFAILVSAGIGTLMGLFADNLFESYPVGAISGASILGIMALIVVVNLWAGIEV